jgi:hypothetical protein
MNVKKAKLISRIQFGEQICIVYDDDDVVIA